MATHFARGILNYGHLLPTRLTQLYYEQARQLPLHQRTRFLASRSLLAELMFMLFGISELPKIILRHDGKPAFIDSSYPRFSIAYAGNIVGVVLKADGECGLGMELQRTFHGFHELNNHNALRFGSNEKLWINNQTDPNEARTQILTLRQSTLKLSGNVHSPSQIQLQPGAGRLRAANMLPVEAICDAEDVLVWSVAATPAIGRLSIWEFDSHSGWCGLPDIPNRASELSTRLMRFTSLPGDNVSTELSHQKE